METDYLTIAKRIADELSEAPNRPSLVDKTIYSALIAIAQELRLIRQQVGHFLQKEKKTDQFQTWK